VLIIKIDKLIIKSCCHSKSSNTVEINKSQNVDYKLSEFGNSVIPIISALKKWSLDRKKEISKIMNI
tara:strand:- start:80 stop:280 length:201 start_codon:yes stop_codon:yes gene_type:complete